MMLGTKSSPSASRSVFGGKGQAAAQQLPLWSGFYKKTVHERLDLIRQHVANRDNAANHPVNTPIDDFNGLDTKVADKMIENCIGYA